MWLLHPRRTVQGSADPEDGVPELDAGHLSGYDGALHPPDHPDLYSPQRSIPPARSWSGPPAARTAGRSADQVFAGLDGCLGTPPPHRIARLGSAQDFGQEATAV